MEGCDVTELKVHSRQHCCLLAAEQMRTIEESSVSTTLEVGTNIVKIREGVFNYRSGLGHPGEPLILLWIYGGRIVNKKTDVEVAATWSTLNGYDDSLVLEVIEPAILCAFFFDSHPDDNEGEILLSVVRI
ncbi:hypothetical protein [Altericista sp. CCNU0014]|uniref:hypothetical protein n=1 Tax=Altericista sp. CCNU0014 TaxID=3082949 RepID=UPI0038500091